MLVSSTATVDTATRAARSDVPTPLRAVRVPDELWNAAVAKAQAEDTTVTAVVLDALRAFIR